MWNPGNQRILSVCSVLHRARLVVSFGYRNSAAKSSWTRLLVCLCLYKVGWPILSFPEHWTCCQLAFGIPSSREDWHWTIWQSFGDWMALIATALRGKFSADRLTCFLLAVLVDCLSTTTPWCLALPFQFLLSHGCGLESMDWAPACSQGYATIPVAQFLCP